MSSALTISATLWPHLELSLTPFARLWWPIGNLFNGQIFKFLFVKLAWKHKANFLADLDVLFGMSIGGSRQSLFQITHITKCVMFDEAVTWLAIASMQDRLTKSYFCHWVTKNITQNFPSETFTHRQNASVGHMQSEHLATLSSLSSTMPNCFKG